MYSKYFIVDLTNTLNLAFCFSFPRCFLLLLHCIYQKLRNKASLVFNTRFSHICLSCLLSTFSWFFQTFTEVLRSAFLSTTSECCVEAFFLWYFVHSGTVPLASGSMLVQMKNISVALKMDISRYSRIGSNESEINRLVLTTMILSMT